MAEHANDGHERAESGSTAKVGGPMSMLSRTRFAAAKVMQKAVGIERYILNLRFGHSQRLVLPSPPISALHKVMTVWPSPQGYFTYKIRNVDVHFPYKAYEVQV